MLQSPFMSASAPMLSIQNLTKRYGDAVAVDDISLEVPRGSFFGFLGPNGAGKSSTIGCITGTHKITGGSISIDGVDVEREYKAARRKVGVSAQEFNVDIFARTWQLIDSMGGYYGMQRSERRARVDELLTLLNLEEHRDKKFQALSGGLKRRVVLARALVHDPALLILDEPTAGVDVEQRLELWEHLRTLHAAGKTIILTSHYLEEIEAMCDEIVVINHGKLVARGSKEVFTKDGSLEERYLAITREQSAPA